MLAINMLAAIVLVHLPKGFSVGAGGYAFVLLLFLGCLTLLFGGAGKKRADTKLVWKE